MGGDLIVESAVGLGSRFYFELTFDTMEISEDDARPALPSNLNEKPVFEGEVLVCEDNLLNQQVISDHLSRVGLQAVIAPNGRKGVEIVKERVKRNEKQFDLIFMDIHMPEMDGLEAAGKIINTGCTTPIVALTANIMANDKEAYVNAGMSDCLSKPFIAKELWTCIYKFIRPVTITKKSEIDNVDDEDQKIGLISTFIKSNRNTYMDIAEALEKGDMKTAHRLAHTLKGVAALIGMSMLSEAAMVIEQSISSGKMDYLEEKMNALKYELATAINELSPMVNEYNKRARKGAAGPLLSKEDALELLKKLEELLQTNSIDSLNLLNDLALIRETETLAEQIENFSFKQALETLGQIRLQLENQ
jgi:CheY-like chemotaxis protein